MTGKLKGKGDAQNGIKRRKYLTQGQFKCADYGDGSPLPNVSQSTPWSTREVAMVDIPGAFMRADMEGETVHMKL